MIRGESFYINIHFERDFTQIERFGRLFKPLEINEFGISKFLQLIIQDVENECEAEIKVFLNSKKEQDSVSKKDYPISNTFINILK